MNRYRTPPVVWRNAVPWRLVPWLAAVAGMSIVVTWQLLKG
jgi:hypothetical protein